jgi:poly-beta-1,6-N-acetyl-D-glucosamine synthase
MSLNPKPTYVLITPAKNEELFIGKTLDSVVSQTLKPLLWVIVDDSSTDRTAEIISKYAEQYNFISLLRMQTSSQRDFGRKAIAFKSGFASVQGLEYSYIGNLDADISLEPDYFQNIVNEFEKNPTLGIAGGSVYVKIGSKFVTGDNTLDSVGGAVQLFRRKCFEEIGGYLPLKQGGIDAAAEITARMKGWSVRKFPENKVWEHRMTGTAIDPLWSAEFKQGMRFHSLGYGTLFYLLRSVAKILDPPLFIGSALSLSGFAYARLSGRPISLPPEIVSYLRREQIAKVKNRIFGSSSKSNLE